MTSCPRIRCLFGRNRTPESTLSPDGGGFREEMPRMRRRGYFCPRKRYLPGRNCIPEGTLSPNGGGFGEEMPFGRGGNAFRTQKRHFCSQKRPFPGRERGVCCICRENREVLPIGVPGRYSREGLDYFFSLSSFALATAGMM